MDIFLIVLNRKSILLFINYSKIYKVYKKKPKDKRMQNIKKYSIIAILTLSVVAGIFNNIPLSYAQSNSTMANAKISLCTK